MHISCMTVGSFFEGSRLRKDSLPKMGFIQILLSFVCCVVDEFSNSSFVLTHNKNKKK